MKIDPYKNQKTYLNWKKKVKDCIPNLSIENSNIIKKFLNEMESGLNVANASKKGARSFARLNSLKDRLIFFCKNFQQYFNLDNITKISEEQLCKRTY